MELQAAAARGGWTAAGRQDGSVVLCAKIGKCTCTFYEQKNSVCIQILHAYTGIGDVETQSPEGCGKRIPGRMRKHHPRECCGNPGICLKYAQGQEKLKGLPRATHCTDRTQTSGNVTSTVELCPPHLTFRIKVRARRGVPEKKNIYIYRYVYMYLLRMWYSPPTQFNIEI